MFFFNGVCLFSDGYYLGVSCGFFSLLWLETVYFAFVSVASALIQWSLSVVAFGLMICQAFFKRICFNRDIRLSQTSKDPKRSNRTHQKTRNITKVSKPLGSFMFLKQTHLLHPWDHWKCPPNAVIHSERQTLGQSSSEVAFFHLQVIASAGEKEDLFCHFHPVSSWSKLKPFQEKMAESNGNDVIAQEGLEHYQSKHHMQAVLLCHFLNSTVRHPSNNHQTN